MTLFQSFKVLFANFSNMWKVLLYRTIVLLLVASIAVAVALPTLSYIYSMIAETGFFTNFAKFLGDILTGSIRIGEFSEVFRENLIEIGRILISNMSKLIVTYLYMVLCLSLSRFLNCVADYALCYVINGKMEAYTKISFTGAIFKNMGRAVKFALVKVMFTVPFDALLILLAGTLFVVLLTPLGIFMPFVIMLALLLIIAFRMTLFSGFLPTLVVEDCSIFGGLKKSVKAVFSRFWVIYSSWFILQFLLIVVACIMTLFTCGVGIFIIIPAAVVFYVVFYLVFYYGVVGRKYYVDHETIITPKLLYDRELSLSYQIKNHTIEKDEKE